MGLRILDYVVARPMIDSGLCPSLVYGQPFRSGKSHDPAWSEVARPFAVYHMESNTSLFMASPDDTTVQRDWKPSSIYQLYGRRCEQRRPKIIVNIYLKVVGLKERKAQHILSINCTNIVPLPSLIAPHPTMSNCSLLLCFLFCRFLYWLKSQL